MSNLISTIDNLKPKFDELAKSHGAVDFSKECLFAKQALQNNSFLMSTASQNPQSLYDAILNISSIGISLNPAMSRAYLVPRGGRICLDVSYKGLCHLAQESGSILWVQAHIVCTNDRFTFNGVGREPTHEFNPFLAKKDRGEFIGVYCVAKTHNGDFLTQMMSADEVYSIRDRSDGYRAFKTKGKSTPWVTDFDEMAKKAVVKQASKMWPKNSRMNQLDEAVQLDHDNDDLPITEILDFDMSKKNETIESIRKNLTEICSGMAQADKAAFLIKELKINKFDDLKRKTQHELDGILQITEEKKAKTAEIMSVKF
jgi:recombination protein RecT